MQTQKRLCAIGLALLGLAVAGPSVDGLAVQSAFAMEQVRELKIYEIPSRNARELTQILQEVYADNPSISIGAIGEKQLSVLAPNAKHFEIAKFIFRPVEKEADTQPWLLGKADARAIADIINERMGGALGSPSASADLVKNTLTIIGSPQQITAIKKMVESLLEEGVGIDNNGGTIETQRKRYPFEFKDTPWVKVFDWLVETSGIPMAGSRAVAGALTFKPEVGPGGRPKQYTIPEIIDELNEILANRLKGQLWIIVRRHATIGIYPADEPLPIDVVKSITLHDFYTQELGKTEYVRVNYQLVTGKAERLAPAIKEFMGPFGQVVPVEEANQLILLDSVGSLRKLIPKIAEIEELHGG